MDTRLADFIKDTPAGRRAGEILRQCVHCGFCNATCPTYQLVGDELDGPRGRIYLIKQMLEGGPVSRKTQRHLDRCLTCRACETTCPSGVRYSELLDIGRQIAATRLPRPLGETLPRRLLAWLLPSRRRFALAVRLGRMFRPLLPGRLADALPPLRPVPAGSAENPPAQGAATRQMLLLGGCVQPALAPSINQATVRVFGRLGIHVFEAARAGCCGAVRLHLNAHEAARDDMRRNVDAWWPHVEAGVEAIVVTASGCGVQVRDYGRLLADDPDYAERSARISALCRDPSELLAAERERLHALLPAPLAARAQVAFQSPCSLQHGLKIRGVAESLLAAAGYQLLPVADGHLCCGSAGTYSVLQPELSQHLRHNKLQALTAAAPEVIATANIGCLTHLQSGTVLPVRHWIELLNDAL